MSTLLVTLYILWGRSNKTPIFVKNMRRYAISTSEMHFQIHLKCGFQKLLNETLVLLLRTSFGTAYCFFDSYNVVINLFKFFVILIHFFRFKNILWSKHSSFSLIADVLSLIVIYCFVFLFPAFHTRK